MTKPAHLPLRTPYYTTHHAWMPPPHPRDKRAGRPRRDAGGLQETKPCAQPHGGSVVSAPVRRACQMRQAVRVCHWMVGLGQSNCCGLQDASDFLTIQSKCIFSHVTRCAC